MRLEEYHMDYIKKVLQDPVHGIEGIPTYEYSDKTNTLTARYKINNFDSTPMIDSEVVIMLLKKGFWVVWAGMYNEDTFEVAVSTTDEWIEYD